MISFITQSLMTTLTGLVVGILFAFLKLPIPAPPVVPAVFGILGLTLGYIAYNHFFGG